MKVKSINEKIADCILCWKAKSSMKAESLKRICRYRNWPHNEAKKKYLNSNGRCSKRTIEEKSKGDKMEKLYRVNFNANAEVEANNEEEAEGKAKTLFYDGELNCEISSIKRIWRTE